MTTKEHPNFRSKAEREQEDDLRSKYRELGNPELVAALKHQKKPVKSQPQMQMSTGKREHD